MHVMTVPMLALENIPQKSRNRPRRTIVEELVKLGDIGNLAELKLNIKKMNLLQKMDSVVDESGEGRVCFCLLENGWQVISVTM